MSDNPPFKVEPYIHTERRRSWGDCQENRGADSDWEEVHKTRYRIILRGEILESGFRSLNEALNEVIKVWTPEALERRIEQVKRFAEQEIQAIQGRRDYEVLKYRDRMRRVKKLLRKAEK